jgi:DNA-binding SARP family transcriptional activator
VEYAVLGPLEVRDGGRTIPIGRGKPRALLALLLLDAGRVVPVERLIDELWGDTPPATAATALQVYVSKLRKALGEGAIRTQPPGYAIAAEQIDVRVFEQLSAQARTAEPARAAALLREALSLWRGTPLSDVELPVERARLEELRLGAVERRIDAELALGQGAELVPELEALVAQEPLRETFRAQLMVALYRADRQAEALDAYRDARRLLVDELGIEPGERLQRLEQAILRHDASLTSATLTIPSATATVLFLDLGARGEVDELVPRALASATEELARSARRVEPGLADAVVGVFSSADEAVARAHAAIVRLTDEFGAAVAPRAGLATADVSIGARVTGAAVVLAARRVREARPGEIVAGDRTAGAAHAHTFRRRGDAYVLVS